MKELFFMLVDIYLLTLIFGSFVSIFRFWKDVKRFHPKEEKEFNYKREFEKSIKTAAEAAEHEEKEAVEHGRDEHNSSVVL